MVYIFRSKWHVCVTFKYVGNEERKRKCSMEINSTFQLNGTTMLLIMKLVSTNDLGSKEKQQNHKLY